MPLQKGKGKKIIGGNIGELMRSFARKGKIGASRPSSKKKASKQASAIAFDLARKSAKKGKKGKKDMMPGGMMMRGKKHMM